MAFTLVEVIASLLLLSTLLVAILTAHGRHARQIRTAQRRLDAIATADRLLAEWNAQGAWGTPAREGPVEGRPDWTWRWDVKDLPNLQPLGAAIGRLEIVSANGESLASLELLTAGPFGATPRQAGYP